MIDGEPVLDAVMMDLLRWSVRLLPPSDRRSNRRRAAGGPAVWRGCRRHRRAVDIERRGPCRRGRAAGEPRIQTAGTGGVAGHVETAQGPANLPALSSRWREHLRELDRRGWVTRLRHQEAPSRSTQHGAHPNRARPAAGAKRSGGRDRGGPRRICTVPSSRSNRQRQDRGVPACDRTGGCARRAGLGAGTGDLVDAPTRRALCGPVSTRHWQYCTRAWAMRNDCRPGARLAAARLRL